MIKAMCIRWTPAELPFWWYGVRGWLIKKLVGSSAVAFNLTVYGGIENRGSADGALIENCSFERVAGGPKSYLVLDPKLDRMAGK